MQDIIIEKPYKFVPPHRGTWWSSFIKRFGLFEWHLRKHGGVVSHECRHVERLRQSVDAGYGVLLTPNHCRAVDPLTLGWLAKQARIHYYAVASWHLFNQDWFTGWAIRKMGAFSINREGIDRQAINTSIEILESAERPLMIFPEGAVSRTNDRLTALLDISFIARAGAKKRAKRVPGSKVVVHPIAIKYLFQGDLEDSADKVLSEIEKRLSWRPQSNVSLIDRIANIGRALLSLKEIEYFGNVQQGGLAERLRGLTDRLLQPLETEWLGGPRTGPTIPRVKALRIKIMPDLVDGKVDQVERERRWRQLADIYLAQQVSSYPPDYFDHFHSVDRLLETIERLEEDLNDTAAVHGSLKAVIEVGDAIEVSGQRDRRSEAEPLMTEIETSLQAMLDRLSRESRMYGKQ